MVERLRSLAELMAARYTTELIARLRARKASWIEAIAVMEEAADALERNAKGENHV